MRRILFLAFLSCLVLAPMTASSPIDGSIALEVK